MLNKSIEHKTWFNGYARATTMTMTMLSAKCFLCKRKQCVCMCVCGRVRERSIYKKLLAVKSKSNDVLRKWLYGNTDLMFIVVIVIVVIIYSLKDLVNILDYSSYCMLSGHAWCWCIVHNMLWPHTKYKCMCCIHTVSICEWYLAKVMVPMKTFWHKVTKS